VVGKAQSSGFIIIVTGGGKRSVPGLSPLVCCKRSVRGTGEPRKKKKKISVREWKETKGGVGGKGGIFGLR